MTDAALTKARNAPEYLREQTQLTRDYEANGMTPAVYMSSLKISLDQAYRDARREERAQRVIGTVVVLGALVVWYLSKRRDSD